MLLGSDKKVFNLMKDNFQIKIYDVKIKIVEQSIYAVVLSNFEVLKV